MTCFETRQAIAPPSATPSSAPATLCTVTYVTLRTAPGRHDGWMHLHMRRRVRGRRLLDGVHLHRRHGRPGTKRILHVRVSCCRSVGLPNACTDRYCNTTHGLSTNAAFEECMNCLDECAQARAPFQVGARRSSSGSMHGARQRPIAHADTKPSGNHRVRRWAARRAAAPAHATSDTRAPLLDGVCLQ